MGYDMFAGMLLEGEVVTVNTDYQAIGSALQSTFTSSALSGILVYAVTACVGLCLFWFAVRKVSAMFMRSFKKGKLRI